MKRFWIYGAWIGILALSTAACAPSDPGRSAKKPPADVHGRIMMLSIASDGRHAISSSKSGHVVLWDLARHTYRVIANHANQYSAYFIKHSPNFLYQSDQDNTVYVENLDGSILKKLHPGFKSYGEVMTRDLKKYFAADSENVVTLLSDTGKRELNEDNGIDFAVSGQVFNLTLSEDERYLTASSAFGELFIWDLAQPQLKPQYFVENKGKTFVAISPDSHWVMTADEFFGGYQYDLEKQAGRRFYYQRPDYAPLKAYTINGYNEYSVEYSHNNGLLGIATLKFIDDKHLLAFFYGFTEGDGDVRESWKTFQPYDVSALYPLTLALHTVPKNRAASIKTVSDNYPYSLAPLRYLPLRNARQLERLQPSTNSFLRAQAIDTNPQTHVLVTGQEDSNGIIVYQYDPQTQTLQRLWDAVVQ